MKKNIIKSIVALIVFSSICWSQTNSEIPNSRIIDWSKAGIVGDIPQFNETQLININDFVKNDSTYDNAFKMAMEENNFKSIRVIYFPAGNYLFTEPIKIKSGIVLRGDGSDKSHLVFSLNNKKVSCISFTGKPQKTFKYSNSLSKGTEQIELNQNLNKFGNCNSVEIFQGKNEWGKSSSGKEKQYQIGQVLGIKEISDAKIFVDGSLRLNYPEKDKWGEPISIRLIESVSNSGIENLSIKRRDKPPKNGGNIIAFNYASNCWLSGVESIMGANNHVSLSHSKNIEIRGSLFSKAFNTGGGGNGYGIVIGGNSTDCLIEDNIFEELRHAMIIASGANGNVFGYNASFYKPIINIDEASISVHGHYPYMNLFEGNYVEYINVDYVWGANGEYNTFLRNYVYHTGVFGLFRNQELQIERGTDKTNIIGNLANVSVRGNDNFILKNMNKEQLNNSMYLETYSFYYKSKPDFIPENISWPCYGLKVAEKSETISNIIPAVARYNSNIKTVATNLLSKTEKPIKPKNERPKTKKLKGFKKN